MFFPCPHCQFLVSHHPQLRPLPADCPQCGRPLQEDGEPSPPVGDGTGSGHPQGIDPGVGGVPIDASLQSGDDVATAAPVASPVLEADTALDDAPQPADDATAPPTHASAIGSGADAPAEDAPPEFTAASTTFAIPVRPSGWSRWRWPLIALLALLLALQILLADRARLAADPRWRPLVESLCGALRCELPAWHEPAAFIMLDRKVRPASQPGALRVDATFRNDARWPQAWPALQLALSDADGRVLGSRVFQPADYLGAAPSTRLSPGQSAQITFVVQEPAPGTVAFSFEFR